ncbi:MAG: hypothetical protein V4501_06660 [Pseudomonadota bacterium]
MLQRLMILILLSLFLPSCASQRDDYRLDVGKRRFAEGNYKEAFHQLLPLAMQGVTKAEYAVGYMYYYGYGVPADTESGMVWMDRAASQGSMPAQRALELIHTGPTPAQKMVAPTLTTS